MASTRWNWGLGANGDTLTTTNTGSSGVLLTGGTGVISTAQAIIGTRSALLTATTTSGVVYWQRSGMSTTAINADMYVYVTAAPSAAVAIMWIGTGSRMVSLEMNTGRTLTIKDAAYTSIWTSTYAIPLNTWVRINIYATQNATTGTVRVGMYLGHSGTAQDDSTLLTGRNTGASAYTDLRQGAKCSTGTQTLTMHVGSWSYDPAATGLPASFGLPSANAGPDQANVEPYTTVTLDSSGSSDSDGSIASRAWTQTAGTTVTLSSSSATSPTFTAPLAATDATLTFQVTVTDNDGNTNADTVNIEVLRATEFKRVSSAWQPRKVLKRNAGAWI